MNYQYRVLSRGLSGLGSNLEKFGHVLEEFLNDAEVQTLASAGWELWQIETLSEWQANNGFLLVLRRQN